MTSLFAMLSIVLTVYNIQEGAVISFTLLSVAVLSNGRENIKSMEVKKMKKILDKVMTITADAALEAALAAVGFASHGRNLSA